MNTALKTDLKTYSVKVTEYLEKDVTVSATNEEEARQAVEDMWENEEVILYPEDFAWVDFEIEKEEK